MAACRGGSLAAAPNSVSLFARRALSQGMLALLALHPHDPDAMGLHITLFGVEVLAAEQLEKDFGLLSDSFNAWRCAATRSGRMLMFSAGATEEVFTQCSQNLFIKRPVSDPAQRARAAWPDAWSPVRPLESLLAMQFESLQVTVSASGLPGASPRDVDRGKALFLGRRGGKAYLLIPYYAGTRCMGRPPNCGRMTMARS